MHQSKPDKVNIKAHLLSPKRHVYYVHSRLLSGKLLLTVVNGSNKPMSVETQNDFTYNILYQADKNNAHITLTSCCEIRLFRFA